MTSQLRGSALIAALALGLVACAKENADGQDSAQFPKAPHSLLPPAGSLEGDGKWRTSVGEVPQPVDPQPIAFNHKLHAAPVAEGGMAMDCQYCHSNARQGKHGGVPGTQVCMGCHKMVDATGRPALESLKTYFPADSDGDGKWSADEVEAGNPIDWVLVHDIPDFVHFNHSRHIAGGVQCTECHADMTKETVAIRAPSMTMQMGWCLDCHSKHPSVDANYGADAELRRAELKDCYTCHK